MKNATIRPRSCSVDMLVRIGDFADQYAGDEGADTVWNAG